MSIIAIFIIRNTASPSALGSFISNGMPNLIISNKHHSGRATKGGRRASRNAKIRTLVIFHLFNWPRNKKGRILLCSGNWTWRSDSRRECLKRTAENGVHQVVVRMQLFLKAALQRRNLRFCRHARSSELAICIVIKIAPGVNLHIEQFVRVY